MQNDDEFQNASGDSKRPQPRLAGIVLLFLVGMLVLMVVTALFRQLPKSTEISASFLREQLAAKNVAVLTLSNDRATGQFKDPPPLPKTFDLQGKLTSKEGKCERHFTAPVSVEFERTYAELLGQSGAIVNNSPPIDMTSTLIGLSLLSVLFTFALVFFWMRYTQRQMMGGGFFGNFTRSPAKRYEASKQVTTFKDVAGIETVKAELAEVVEFLRQPKKFQKLGGRVPKGVLLNGPPGTGKTLLARAVAGEAGVPFFSVNGSEFIQMFVGVGASRVRDLFAKAKESSPAIIFIDEIDAVGRQRGAGLGGGHDEREQTLNQILGEMDGFTQTDFVIVMGATNRPDVLDPALLRPGRFDRHITVGRPTQKGRLEIFKVHTRHVPLADDVDLKTLAAATIGLTGADIRNIVNEAALWAARNDKSKVSMDDFEYSRDKILMGPKREEVLQGKEKEKTAYHEAGHALLAWKLPGSYKVHKVTILPRGRALGVTQMLPTEERLMKSESELRDHLTVFLGGRMAERIIYNESDAGAESDLERATSLARRMVTSWGMSERLGPVSYKITDEDPFLGRELHQQRQFSEHTLQVIDAEVARILTESAERAKQLLIEHRGALEKLTQALLDQEELDEAELTRLIGPSVHAGSSAPELETSVATRSSDASSADKG